MLALSELIKNFKLALTTFEMFDLMVVLINGLVFLFRRKIANWLAPGKGEDSIEKRVRFLTSINLLAFCLYFISFFSTEEHVVAKISQTALTLLIAYLAVNLVGIYTRIKFGRERMVEDEKILSETYQSEMFGLLGLIVVLIASFLLIINIWQLTDWLQATSVVGGLLVIAYSTKDVWAPENIHGLLMLYHGEIVPGSVVRAPELNLLGVVKQITLTQVELRDLRQRHQILIPNSRFRNAKLEVLSNVVGNKGMTDYVDFKIGYGTPSDQIEAYLTAVWEKSCSSDSGINPEVRPRIRVIENGDHAVTWRLFYSLGNIYRMLSARFCINRSAYDLMTEHQIDLSTPYTHEVAMQSSEPAKKDLGPDIIPD